MFDAIPSSWQPFFQAQLAQEYFKNVLRFVEVERKQSTVFPSEKNTWHAFEATDFTQLKVVIIGQDPYHGAGQAHGLSFSVPEGIKIPPSLKNIFKEISLEFDTTIPHSGNLEDWAKQGVLLLNACLTVREGEPASHSKQGWEIFTSACIDYINKNKQGVVFLAWGRFAHEVCKNIDTNKHSVIKTSHPSPLGASKQGKDFTAFLSSGCFKQCNAYLRSQGKTEVNWNLAENQPHTLGFEF
ncbi:uracil-DNA glycosylase [Oceaniserpentilla sp. 4NH20-0058]|uniref:uracil-DNA glycosylase n=1 Tax=Oceaniserpentilla sp. 4NH20-0058 TaxID=3127660 RepID=UPI00310863E6